jgi:hypothetical protein
MTTWADFEKANPELAAFGQARLTAAPCYFATVRKDGSPRVHPVTPIIGEGRLFLFMEPTSPKGKDLQRDGRYSMHCSVSDNEGGAGEFFISGHGKLTDDPATRTIAIQAAKYAPKDRYILFELSVESAFSTVYDDSGSIRNHWNAEGA